MTALILLSEFRKTEIELWKPIPDFSGYDASSLGRIRSWRMPQFKRGVRGSISGRRLVPLLLKEMTRFDGRHTVCLCRGSKRITRTVHSLIAQTFLAKSVQSDEVNHKTGIYIDNRVGNLEYQSHQGNWEHAVKFGLVCHGERVVGAKLRPSDIVEIRQRCANGEPQRKIALAFGVTQPLIGMIHRREIWRRVD